MRKAETDVLEPGKLWWNWFGEHYFVPANTVLPRSEEDVRQAVLAAARLGLPVRSSGRGHANTAAVPTPVSTSTSAPSTRSCL